VTLLSQMSDVQTSSHWTRITSETELESNSVTWPHITDDAH